MKKCARVKNPCKICLQTVTNKNGIQCRGACKKWAHFTCLNYTPGKIKDIKAGIITVTCPCPNCNVAAEVKEFLTDPSFTCTDDQCPANVQPKCTFEECPVNKGISPQPCPPLTSMSRGVSPKTCSPACSKSKTLAFPDVGDKAVTKPCSPVKDGGKPPIPPCVDNKAPVNPSSCMPNCNSGTQNLTAARMPSRQALQKQVSSCASADKLTGTSPKSASCSLLCPGLCSGEKLNDPDTCTEETRTTITLKSGDCKITCSDSKLMTANLKQQNEKDLLCTIQELCSTVGHLSQQVKDLMCKMISKLDDNK